MANPKGIMKTMAATFSTTAQAATARPPIQPAITFIPEKAMTSKKLEAPAP